MGWSRQKGSSYKTDRSFSRSVAIVSPVTFSPSYRASPSPPQTVMSHPLPPPPCLAHWLLFFKPEKLLFTVTVPLEYKNLLHNCDVTDVPASMRPSLICWFPCLLYATCVCFSLRFASSIVIVSRPCSPALLFYRDYYYLSKHSVFFCVVCKVIHVASSTRTYPAFCLQSCSWSRFGFLGSQTRMYTPWYHYELQVVQRARSEGNPWH